MKINEKNLFDANSVAITEDVSKIDEVLNYEEILLSISKSIMNYRKTNYLTQEKLAHKLKMDQTMISKIERGNYNPTIKLLYTISVKLTKSTDLFIDVLKDIIRSLYKSKNIKYQLYETYEYMNNQSNGKVTYLKKYHKKNNNFGGMIYGTIHEGSRFSTAR